MARDPIKALRLTILALLTAVLFASTCHAADDDHPSLLTFYFARGADPNIFMIFPEMIRGERVIDNTSMYALGYFHQLATPGGLQKVFDFLLVPNTRTGIEGIVGKHNGLQHNWEADAVWQLRFASLRLPMIRVRPAVGVG